MHEYKNSLTKKSRKGSGLARKHGFLYYEKHPEAWRRAETQRTAWEYMDNFAARIQKNDKKILKFCFRRKFQFAKVFFFK
jgi:hypothetical protein